MTIEYPSAAEIHELHNRIVAGGSKTEPGIRKSEAVESALAYISEGYFDQTPKTIHEKAAHLLRLIVADHPYVDGNKRTALWAAAYLYELNGYRLEPDNHVRQILREIATDAEEVDFERVVTYLRHRTTSVND